MALAVQCVTRTVAVAILVVGLMVVLSPASMCAILRGIGSARSVNGRVRGFRSADGDGAKHASGRSSHAGEGECVSCPLLCLKSGTTARRRDDRGLGCGEKWRSSIHVFDIWQKLSLEAHVWG